MNAPHTDEKKPRRRAAGGTVMIGGCMVTGNQPVRPEVGNATPQRVGFRRAEGQSRKGGRVSDVI